MTNAKIKRQGLQLTVDLKGVHWALMHLTPVQAVARGDCDHGNAANRDVYFGRFDGVMAMFQSQKCRTSPRLD